VLEEHERLEEEQETQGTLTEEEIEERCDALRQRLLKALDEESESGGDRRGGRDRPDKKRQQFKSYQVHELAEAKMHESERLRKALGINEDWEREKEKERDGPATGPGAASLDKEEDRGRRRKEERSGRDRHRDSERDDRRDDFRRNRD
jgi:hypothetical protein